MNSNAEKSFARPDGVYTRDDWPAVAGASLQSTLWGGIAIELSADVVVVGSGAGGAVVAAELAEGGLDVIVVEEGGYHPTQEFSSEATKMVRTLYRDGGVTFGYGLPPVLLSEGKCVGGSTVINGAMSWATPEKILERWEREHGVEQIAPGPMARYFARVERFISAKLNDPETIGRDNQLLYEGARKKGWKVIPNIRAQSHCAGSNSCAWGCPTGAKQSTLVSYLPRALAFGARIYADCRVDKVLRDRRGAVTGVQGNVITPANKKSHRFVIRAPKVVLCAGALQTPALLTRSGIRSPSGQIGRNLALHPNAKQIAFFDEDVEGYKGAHQLYQVREFRDQGILMAAVNVPPTIVGFAMPGYGRQLVDTMKEYNRMVTAAVLVEDSVFGRVRTLPGGRPLVTYQVSDRDAEVLVHGSALLADLLLTAGAKRIITPFAGFPEIRNHDDIAKLRQTRIPKHTMELMTVHLMGSARMGSDPKRHVCDSWGKVYGTAGLYLADASIFPSPIGVNPMETIMALATRNAERLLDTC